MFVIQKKGKEGKKLANYHCFLFSDIFIYASKSKITSRVTCKKLITFQLNYLAARNTSDLNLLKDTYKYKGHFSNYKLSVQLLEDSESRLSIWLVANDSSNEECIRIATWQRVSCMLL